MKALLSSFVFVAVLLIPPLAWADASSPYRIKSESRKLKGSAVRLISSEAHFPQKPDEVWKILNDFAALPSFIPRLKTFEPLGTAHGREQVYISMDLPIPFPDMWNVISLKKDDPKRRFEWEMLQGNMNKNSGSIQLDADGEGTVVLMEVQADPGLFLPHWLVAWGAKNFFPKILKAFGQRMDQKYPLAPEVFTPTSGITPVKQKP